MVAVIRGLRAARGIYELVTVDENLRELIHDRASEQVMTEYVRRNSPGIAADGCRKVLAGITTVNEVMRVSFVEEAPVEERAPLSLDEQ